LARGDNQTEQKRDGRGDEAQRQIARPARSADGHRGGGEAGERERHGREESQGTRVARGCRSVLTIAQDSDLLRVRNPQTMSSTGEDNEP